MSCRRLLHEGALEPEAVGGQVCTEASDLSDSVTEGVERCLFSGFSAAVVFVAAFRLGLVGGSAITIDVDGISIDGAKSHVTSTWRRCYHCSLRLCGHPYSKCARYVRVYRVDRTDIVRYFSVFHAFGSF